MNWIYWIIGAILVPFGIFFLNRYLNRRQFLNRHQLMIEIQKGQQFISNNTPDSVSFYRFGFANNQNESRSFTNYPGPIAIAAGDRIDWRIGNKMPERKWNPTHIFVYDDIKDKCYTKKLTEKEIAFLYSKR